MKTATRGGNRNASCQSVNRGERGATMPCCQKSILNHVLSFSIPRGDISLKHAHCVVGCLVVVFFFAGTLPPRVRHSAVRDRRDNAAIASGLVFVRLGPTLQGYALAVGENNSHKRQRARLVPLNYCRFSHISETRGIFSHGIENSSASSGLGEKI